MRYVNGGIFGEHSAPCNRLQPHVPQAATPRAAGCNPMHRSIPPPGSAGELDFFLGRRRAFDAVATSEGCTVLLLTREALKRMQAHASPLAAALEHAVLKYLCFQAPLTTYYLLCSSIYCAQVPSVLKYLVCSSTCASRRHHPLPTTHHPPCSQLLAAHSPLLAYDPLGFKNATCLCLQVNSTMGLSPL